MLKKPPKASCPMFYAERRDPKIVAVVVFRELSKIE